MAVRVMLYAFISRAFSNEEMRIFLAHGSGGPELVQALPNAEVPRSTYMDAVVEVLERRNRIDRDLLARLRAARPGWGSEIDRMANLLGHGVMAVEAVISPPAALPGFVAEIPIGPGVPTSCISQVLIEAFAEATPDFRSVEPLLNDAVRLRLQADERPTYVQMGDLPAPSVVGIKNFWQAALFNACRHGPRMLAALLIVLPDSSLTTRMRHDRDDLLARLRDRTYRPDL